MLTTIEKKKQISSGESAIYLIYDTSKLKSLGFSADEIHYIKTRNEKDETKIFAFNRLAKWDFVQFFKKDDTDATAMETCRKAGNNILAKINTNKILKIIVTDAMHHPSVTLAFIEGMALGNYQFNKYKKNKDTEKSFNTLEKIILVCDEITGKTVSELNILIEAVYIARDLVNEPVSFMNAEKLALEAEKLCSVVGAKVEILNKLKIETLKMGGLLSVNKGSIDPPTFTVIEWKPAKHENMHPFILVGKGVVYDTGGICLKPTSGLETMKCDMSGAASVIGAIYAISKSKLPIHVIGLIPATDNRPDGNSQVPGDVITMYDGTTVEVMNTDAEGRLILADALSYAKKYKPELVIDLATLTGSAYAALGKFAMVAMGKKSEKYMEQLKQAGENVCERLVEFPLWDDYKDLIKSEVADMKNVGGLYAGAITAGKFLEHFTDYPWIHLDIAGPAYMDTFDNYRGRGGTGWGVRILFDFVKGKCS